MRKLFILALLASSVAASAAGQALAETKPTVVLVHGAFADASSWNGVIKKLEKDGYPVIAAANPLRSVSEDADYVHGILASIKNDVVLVGHSYGGVVITQAASGASNVKSLVYVAAFAPDVGESALDLTSKFPGSSLPPTLAAPVELQNGGKDLYIDQAKFPAQFAADVPLSEAKLMAATQRPVTQAALSNTVKDAPWKTIPTYFVYGDADKNIPPKAIAWMAERAHSKGTVIVKKASHVVMVSHPDRVAQLIEEAAR